MRIVWTEVPEYVAALARETCQRDAAFFLERETLCGFEVLPFTPRHFITLASVGCPFVNGGFPTQADLARFLWVVCPDFRPITPEATMRDRRIRQRWIRRARPLNLLAGCAAIELYLNDALADSPGNSAPEGSPSDYSLAAGLVDLIATSYGWTEERVLNTPFKKLWQYFRAIRRRADPNAVFINATDGVKRRHWLKLQPERVATGPLVADGETAANAS